MKKNKIINNFLVLFFLISTAQIGMPLEDEYLNLKVRVFRILPFQSIVTKVTSTQDGGVSGEVIGGKVTASFPEGIVLLETDLYQNNEDLVKYIKEKVKFSCLGKKTGISHVDALNVFINAKNLEASVEGEGLYPKTYGHAGNLLHVLPLSIEKEEVIFRVKFQGFEKKLLD